MKKKIILPLVISLTVLGQVACSGSSKSENTVSASDSVAVVISEQGDVFSVDGANSKLAWKGFKPGGEHFGHILLTSGEVKASKERLFAGSVVIDMGSLVVGDLEGDMALSLKKHLESEDFFEVTTYPEAKFELTDIPEEGLSLSDLRELKGNLTLKGVTKNITIPIKHVDVTEESDLRSISSEVFRINRADWNVKYGSKTFFGDLGDKFIEDEIELSFELVLSKAEG